MFCFAPLVLSLALCLGPAQAWSTRSYKSVPFTTPAFDITKSGKPLAPGYILLTTTVQPYAASTIITDEGELVWLSQPGDFTNLNVQTFNSKPVLTYWNGTGSANVQVAGHGYGRVQILDSSYTVQHNICPDLELILPGGTTDCQADLHESYVTDRGSLLVTAYNATQADLSSVNGPVDGWVYDCLVFEIDIKTQKILFSWSALKAGIPISDTKEPLGSSGTLANPFDFFHINSIQSVGSSYLINSRHTWTTYLLNRKGDIEWRFEGSTGGDFTLPSDVHFAWQHHPRVLDVTPSSLVLHLFDNGNSGPPHVPVNQTLGLLFSLDLKKKTSTLLKKFYDPKQALYADSQGDFNLLPNGNALMGYGQLPIVREYGPHGDVRLSIQFGELNGTQQSYRAYRLEWEGIPAADPVVFAEKGHAYASWNGATSIRTWEVYEGTTPHNLRYTRSVKKSDFETEFPISNSARFVKVAAVTPRGKRSSAVVPVV